MAARIKQISKDKGGVVHAWDTETTGIDPSEQGPVGNGRVICASFYSGPEYDYGDGPRVWIDNLAADNSEVLLTFKEVLEDDTIQKVWHNYSFDRHVLWNHGIASRGFRADTMHMARIYDSSLDVVAGGSGYSLAALSQNPKLLNLPSEGQKHSIKDLFGTPRLKKDGTAGAIKDLPALENVQRSDDAELRRRWIEYSSKDAEVTWKLFRELERRLVNPNVMPWRPESVCFSDIQFNNYNQFDPLEAAGKIDTELHPPSMMQLYDRVIRPFGELLTDLERNGIAIDPSMIEAAAGKAEASRDMVKKRFKDWASTFVPGADGKPCPDLQEMNVHSDVQKCQLLFGTPVKPSKVAAESKPAVKDSKSQSSSSAVGEPDVANDGFAVSPGAAAAPSSSTLPTSPPELAPTQAATGTAMQTQQPAEVGTAPAKPKKQRASPKPKSAPAADVSPDVSSTPAPAKKKGARKSRAPSAVPDDPIEPPALATSAVATSASTASESPSSDPATNLSSIAVTVPSAGASPLPSFNNRRSPSTYRALLVAVSGGGRFAHLQPLLSAAVRKFSATSQQEPEWATELEPWSDATAAPLFSTSASSSQPASPGRGARIRRAKPSASQPRKQQTPDQGKEVLIDVVQVLPTMTEDWGNVGWSSESDLDRDSADSDGPAAEYQPSFKNSGAGRGNDTQPSSPSPSATSSQHPLMANSIDEPVLPRKYVPTVPADSPVQLQQEIEFETDNTIGYIDPNSKRRVVKKKRPFKIPSMFLPIQVLTPGGRPAANAAAIKKLIDKPIDKSPAYTKLLADGCTPDEAKEGCARIGDLLEIAAVDTTLETFLRPLAELGVSDMHRQLQQHIDDSFSVDPDNFVHWHTKLQGAEAMTEGKTAAYKALAAELQVPVQPRVHCSMNLNTETGRLSARRPNLQNQPSLERDKYKIRAAFVAPPGKKLIVADYGQLELRVLAHLTGCTSMIEAFKLGGDFHSRTAMGMYAYIKKDVDAGEVLLEWDEKNGVPPKPLLKDKYKEERRRAKILNFSIAYGKTSYGLSKDWNISLEEAEKQVNLWYGDRPEVRNWQDETKAKARRSKKVFTILGRHRDLPLINNKAHRNHYERASINTPIQGSAADIVMCAMIKIHHDVRLRDLGFRMLLQVHDEVILEGPAEKADEALQIVVELMKKPFDKELKLELTVDAKCVSSWADAK